MGESGETGSGLVFHAKGLICWRNEGGEEGRNGNGENWGPSKALSFLFCLCLVIFMSMWCLLLFKVWTQFHLFWKRSYPSFLGKLLKVQRDTAVRGLHSPCPSMKDQYRVVVMLTVSVEGRRRGARPGTVPWLEWDASESGWWSEMGWRDSSRWDRYWGGRMQRADDWRRAGGRETSIRNDFWVSGWMYGGPSAERNTEETSGHVHEAQEHTSHPYFITLVFKSGFKLGACEVMGVMQGAGARGGIRFYLGEVGLWSYSWQMNLSPCQVTINPPSSRYLFLSHTPTTCKNQTLLYLILSARLLTMLYSLWCWWPLIFPMPPHTLVSLDVHLLLGKKQTLWILLLCVLADVIKYIPSNTNTTI